MVVKQDACDVLKLKKHGWVQIKCTSFSVSLWLAPPWPASVEVYVLPEDAQSPVLLREAAGGWIRKEQGGPWVL